MHKTTTLRLGKFGLTVALVGLYFSGIAQNSSDVTLASPVVRYASTPVKPNSSKVDLVASMVIDIRGKVTDEKGEPLPGVTVVVKGTTNGTATGVDGTYTLNLPEASGTLVFSYVGYNTREVPISSGQTSINVTLQVDAKALEEVVVVGYGTQKRANVTGAVSSITIDDQVASRAVPNVSSAMAGLVPGLSAVQSTGMAGRNGAALVIRGLGSVNGNSSPLVVVDGMPDVDINRIDMNDVETISVLKDAASASVYGSRAANGVILITTKSGKGKKKATINFTSTNALEVANKSYDFMSDYARALTLHQRAAAVNTLPSNFTFRNGTVDQWMALGLIDPIKYPNTDWWDIIMRDGNINRQNLSASGGNDLSNFYISVGLINQKGLQINNDYKQYNTRINYDYKVRKNINVGIKLNGNTSNLTYALEDGFTDDDATNTAGFDMQYAISGMLPYDPTTGYFGGVMAYGEDPQAYNPYTVYVNNLTRQNRQQANGNIYIDWSPIEGLTARVDYALNYANQFQVNANMPNQAYNFQQGAFGSRTYVGNNAGISNRTDSDYKTMFTGRLNYNKKLGVNHEISALAVYSEEYWNERYQSSSRTDRLHPTLSQIDAALPGTQTANGGLSTEGLRSYIGRLNYTAFDKYLLEANFRYDGSSKFLPGFQYGFFPSVAVGWRFVEESFIKSFTSRFLSNGKLRLSYGGLGNNSGVGRFEQQEVLANNNYMIGGNIAKGFVYSKMINPDLSWESTNVFNAGLDLGFFDNRLSTEIDYYDRLTTGMIRPSDFSIHLSGAYSPAPRRNIGNLRNRGVETNITWADNIGQIRYGLNLNASYNRNVLEKWNEFIGRGSNFNGNQIFVNMPFGFIYAYESMGIAQTWQDVYNATPQGASPGDVLRKDLNGDGRIDGNDRKADPDVQRSRPNTNFALNTNASWKGFDLVAFFQGSAGRKDYWLNNYNNVNFGTQRYASTWQHWQNPWNLENRTGEWPRLGGSGNREETTFWLDDMSFIRIKNLQLGYTVPVSLLSRAGITSLRIFGSAENLATFTKFRGLDPEKGTDRNDMYPIVKSYSVGVNLSL